MRELLEMAWCCKNERINTSMRIRKLIQVFLFFIYIFFIIYFLKKVEKT